MRSKSGQAAVGQKQEASLYGLAHIVTLAERTGVESLSSDALHQAIESPDTIFETFFPGLALALTLVQGTGVENLSYDELRQAIESLHTISHQIETLLNRLVAEGNRGRQQ